nr:hypothetical protein BaRGS_022995 [Batillaria attramentaria]
MMTGTCSCSVGVAKVKKVALSSFQTMVFNLYNVRTKIRCATAPFKSERELPLHTVVDTATMEKCLHERLEQVFEEGDEHRQIFCNLGKSLLNETSAKAMVKTLSALYSLCWDVISQWGAQDKVFIGVIPKPCCSGSDLTIDVDQQANKLFVHWPREELGPCATLVTSTRNFLKVVNLTAAAASAAFFLGAAECKVSMERLSTNQALRYMRALRAQVPRSKNQFLSAAWNLNQILQDDFDHKETTELTERMDIAMRAIEITSFGGFDKVTWDGASDTYPSKCIMYQLSHKEALTIVHEAHLKGLVTYFSAGFKFNEIRHAVYAGVDGIGIGGAQVLRYMDSETGMHGPYMEENIPRILANRDEAAEVSARSRRAPAGPGGHHVFRGGPCHVTRTFFARSSSALCWRVTKRRSAICFFALPASQPCLQKETFPTCIEPRRLVEAENPMLKEFCTQEEVGRADAPCCAR